MIILLFIYAIRKATDFMQIVDFTLLTQPVIELHKACRLHQIASVA